MCCDVSVLNYLWEGTAFVMNGRVVSAGKKGFEGIEGSGEDSSTCQG